MLHAVLETDGKVKWAHMTNINPVVFDGWKCRSLYLLGEVKDSQISNFRNMLEITKRAVDRRVVRAKKPALIVVSPTAESTLRIQALLYSVADIDALLAELPS